MATIAIPPTTPPIRGFDTVRTGFDSAVSDPTVTEGVEELELVAVATDVGCWDAEEASSSALS